LFGKRLSGKVIVREMPVTRTVKGNMTPFLTLSKIAYFLLYRVQLTLFHSDEVLDDDYTLTDVAYITAWNAVSMKCILSTKLEVCDIFFT